MKSCAVWLSLLWAPVVIAQTTFDVASIKQGGPVRPDGLLDINLGSARHGTVTLTNTTLSECLQYAYALTNQEQIAGPDWIRDRSIRFEIVAKAQPDTPIDQLRLMLQALLRERFRLETHREPKKMSHLMLTVDRNGTRMPAAEGDGAMMRNYYGPGRLSYTRVPMDRLAVLLSRQLKQPVLDRTGLTGAYDVELNWQPDDAPADVNPGERPDVFTAVRQQLGLRLEPSKEPLEVLVVDRAEKVPIQN